MRKSTAELQMSCGAIVFMLLAVTCFMFVQASFEASTFNKFKDPEIPKATVWDAMFADLRVEARE